jgi:O-antigen ligase
LVNKKLLSGGLLVVSTASAFFGWIQFFVFPDLKPFTVYGWDMHLYRLAGTFMDPTYLGLIIVFGLMFSIDRFIESKEKKHLFLAIFLLVSLAFTYSRASYLAFLGAFFVLAVMKKKLRKVLYWVFGLLLVAMLLPTARNHSISLTRTFSIEARINNYNEGIEIFKKYPLFGVGFNNMCIARNKFVEMEPFSSHACSGSDSSLILILATTGMAGLMIFFGSVMGISSLLKKNHAPPYIIASLAALFIHSFFSNSMFFPWIMVATAILFALSFRE